MDVFIRSQLDAEERFQKREERWKEMELEENQRREERQYQLQMIQMLGEMIVKTIPTSIQLQL